METENKVITDEETILEKVVSFGQREFDLGKYYGRHDGIRFVKTYILKRAGDLFTAKDDKLAPIYRDLVDELENMDTSRIADMHMHIETEKRRNVLLEEIEKKLK